MKNKLIIGKNCKQYTAKGILITTCKRKTFFISRGQKKKRKRKVASSINGQKGYRESIISWRHINTWNNEKNHIVKCRKSKTSFHPADAGEVDVSARTIIIPNKIAARDVWWSRALSGVASPYVSMHFIYEKSRKMDELKSKTRRLVMRLHLSRLCWSGLSLGKVMRFVSAVEYVFVKVAQRWSILAIYCSRLRNAKFLLLFWRGESVPESCGGESENGIDISMARSQERGNWRENMLP